jgi:hypothetical protein
MNEWMKKWMNENVWCMYDVCMYVYIYLSLSMSFFFLGNFTSSFSLSHY